MIGMTRLLFPLTAMMLLVGCNEYESYAQRMAIDKDACEKVRGEVVWVRGLQWSGRPYVECNIRTGVQRLSR